MVTDSLLLKFIGFNDCNIYLSFKTFNFVLIVTVYHIYFFLPQAEVEVLVLWVTQKGHHWLLKRQHYASNKLCKKRNYD